MLPLKAGFRDCKAIIESALACQHIDWRMCHRVRCCPEALACGVFAAGADGEVGVRRLAANKDADPCADGLNRKAD